MSIDAKITPNLYNNYTNIEISSDKGRNIKNFQVPKNKANSFVYDYKKFDKTSSIVANTAFGVSIVAGVLATSLLTKKINNKVLKWIIGSTGGIVGAIGSIILSSKYINNKENKLLQLHNAARID